MSLEASPMPYASGSFRFMEWVPAGDVSVEGTAGLVDAPLRGRRVAITRPTERVGAIAEQLRAVQAVPVLVSLTRVEPPADDAPLRQAAANVDRFDWVVFTSVNAVRSFAAALPGRPPRAAITARIAAVGPGTALAVHDLLHKDVDVMPAEFSSAALADALLQTGALAGAAVLWPRAEAASDGLARCLVDNGARLEAPVAYRTACDPAAARVLSSLVMDGAIDVLTFAAPSAARCYADAGGAIGNAVVAVIGATTADAAGELGIPVHVQPREQTTAALVSELRAHFARHTHR